MDLANARCLGPLSLTWVWQVPSVLAFPLTDFLSILAFLSFLGFALSIIFNCGLRGSGTGRCPVAAILVIPILPET